MIGISKTELLSEYGKKLAEGNAALFVGAGLSRPAGYVDWPELLRDIAADLGLSVDREHDLVALAQYHYNQRRSRARLNEKLIEEFTKDAKPTENHRLIAQLPIHTIWTTNYDTLVEDAFRSQFKRVDVKITSANVAQTRPGTEAVVYKMHGDVSQPQDAILTKEDYETYHLDREIFTIRLKGDLVSLTFLFLGFSFTDPNIDYVLSRIRGLLGKNIPAHYCIIRRPQLPAAPTPEVKAQYDYDMRKLALRVEDLKRYGVQTVLIDSYDEVTEILTKLNRRAFLRNIFVSGSAAQGTCDFDLARLSRFARCLGRQIIEQDYNLVSGYGLGIGTELLVGALQSAYVSPSSMRERLILRPFPLSVNGAQKRTIYRDWRKGMVSLAGFSVFLAGNKLAPGSRTEVIRGRGVMEEFELATAPTHLTYPIPVGATGFVAKEIWTIVSSDLNRFYGAVDVSPEMGILDDARHSDDELVQAIFSVIRKVCSRRA